MFYHLKFDLRYTMYTYTIGLSSWQQIEDTASMSFLIRVFLRECEMLHGLLPASTLLNQIPATVGHPTPAMISSLLKQFTPGWDLSWPEELQQTSEHQALAWTSSREESHCQSLISSSLRGINLSSNHLEGIIPEDLCRIVGLRSFIAAGNHTSRTSPEDLPPHLHLWTLD
jgi:hypothetical protein